ncbi:MAG: hypothetical protein JWL73_307 [Actinomycetia bacterium]|nr:hypothetical protein [Actinomycetes bacterium]
MDKTRFEAFSDGVFAVAITLLALDLTVAGPGHGSLAHQLGDRWPSFLAYVVSFFTIGIVAVNHHALFRQIARVDRVLVFCNLLLLMFVVAIPFATATMAQYLRDGGFDARLAAALYAGMFVGMSVGFFLVFWWSIRRSLLVVPLDREQARAAMLRFGVGNVVYVVAVALAFVSPIVALLLCAALAIYYVFEQTPTADAVTPT